MTRPGQPLAMQRPHLPVRSETPFPALGRQRFRLGLRLGRRDKDAALCGSLRPAAGLFHRAQVASVGSERHLQRLGQVLQQVEAVCHLNGCGGAVVGALGIRTGAVARDHRDAGVLAQPGRERARLAVGQQRHGTASVEVHQHGAVGVPLAQRPVVHAQRGGCRDAGQRCAPDQAQQRVAARVQPEPAAEACASSTAECETHGREPPRQARRLACPRHGDAGQHLGEDAAFTAGSVAEQAPDLQSDRDGVLAPGQVGEGALVVGWTRLDRLPQSGQRAVACRARRVRVIVEEAGSKLQVSSRTWVASGSKHESRFTRSIWQRPSPDHRE
jgi:hypothetical protein